MTATRTLVLAVALVAIIGLPAMAQTPRQNATAGGFAAVSVDETASFLNPAGLPLLQTFGSQLSPWPSRASINALIDGPSGLDQYSAFYASRAADTSRGWGASYQRADNGFESDAFSLGYGQQFGDGFTAGVSLFHQSLDSDSISTDQVGDLNDDVTSFDLGAMYRHEMALNTWRFGLWVEDVADEYGGPFYHLGAAVELPAGVDIAATLFDISDEVDSMLGIGAEWAVPMSQILVRAGNFDGDFTAGAAYQWTNFEVGLSWMDGDNDDLITAGVTGCF